MRLSLLVISGDLVGEVGSLVSFPIGFQEPFLFLRWLGVELFVGDAGENFAIEFGILLLLTDELSRVGQAVPKARVASSKDNRH